MSEVDHASNWDRLIFALEFVVNSEINMELTTSQCKYLLDKLTSLTDRVADLEAERRWIPVSERLPGIGNLVYVRDADGNYDNALYEKTGFDRWNWNTEYGLIRSEITHWTHLPDCLPEDK
jgi:hypothetical protein